MRIALVTDWYEPRVGGIELHLQDLAQRLIGRGHEVHVVTPTPGRALVDGVRVHRIEAPRAPRFGFLITRGGVRAIGRVLESEKFDVAHCHVSIVSPAAFGGAAQAQRLGIPTVVTFHSVVPATRLLAFGLNVVIRCSRWNAEWTAVSQRVAREMTPLVGGREIGILRNGVDLDFWRAPVIPSASSVIPSASSVIPSASSVIPSDARDLPSAAGGESQQPHRRSLVADAPRDDRQGVQVISVMRLNAKKRPMAVVELGARLAAGGFRHVRIKIVGDGPQRARLEREIARRGLGDRVELLGRRTREEIRELYRESDVFVLPTLRESFGLAALEARAAGLPVVAMAASGVSELIEHARNGLLAKSDSEFAEQVGSLCQDAELRARLSADGGRLPEGVDWASAVDSHLQAYTAATRSQPRGRQ